MRLAFVLAVLIFGLTLAGEVVFLLSLPLVELVHWIPDDSFFFLKLAQNLIEFGDFTFDGYTTTYGFQPLWQLLLVPLGLVFDDPRRLLDASIVLCCVLHVATGFALWRLATALFGAIPGAVASASWTLNPAIMQWCWGLKENALYALLLTLALHALLVIRRRGPSLRRALVLGALMGLCVFTRANAALVPILLGTTLLLPMAGENRTPFVARLRCLATTAIATIVVGAPWYVYAWLHFGTPMPTSGLSKFAVMESHVVNVWKLEWQSFAHYRRALLELPAYLRDTLVAAFGPVEFALAALLAFAPIAALIAALHAWRHRSRASEARPPLNLCIPIAALGLAVLAAAVNVAYLQPFLSYARWYTVPEYVAIPLLIALLVWLLVAAARVLPVGVLAIFGICCAASYATLAKFERRPTLFELERGLHLRAPSKNQQLLEFGLWAARNVPDEARVAIWDPGIVSFFSQKRLTSIDPLMNSLEYQRKLSECRTVDEVAARLLGYCAEQKVSYVFGASLRWPDGQLRYRYLPPNTSTLVWQPYAEDLAWGSPKVWWTVVRPAKSEGPAFLDRANFGFGAVNGSAALTAEHLARRVAKLRGGFVARGDVLRLRVDGAEAPTLQLAADGNEAIAWESLVTRLEARFDAPWALVDLRPYRGRKLQVLLSESDAARIREAYSVDYSFPAGSKGDPLDD